MGQIRSYKWFADSARRFRPLQCVAVIKILIGAVLGGGSCQRSAGDRSLSRKRSD